MYHWNKISYIYNIKEDRLTISEGLVDCWSAPKQTGLVKESFSCHGDQETKRKWIGSGYKNTYLRVTP